MSSSKAPTADLIGASALPEHPTLLVTMTEIALVLKALDLFQGSEAIKGEVVGINWAPPTLLWQLRRASNLRI